MNDLIGMRSADLAVFARVVEAGGFTAAAKAMGTPQTTISRRVAKLEDELGVRLLERTTRKVNVTEVGKRIYQHARRIIEEAESAQSVATSLQDEPVGLVRISAPLVFGQHLVAPAIAQFLADYPKAKVQIDLSGRQVDLIEEGIDVAIRLGPLPPSSLIKRTVMHVNAAYFARRDIAQVIREPSDLVDADWLHAGTEHGETEWSLISENGDRVEHRFAKEPRMTSSDIETLITCANIGLGVAVLPEFAAPQTLARVLPDYVSRRAEISALTASHKSITPAVRTFISQLQEVCAQTASSTKQPI